MHSQGGGWLVILRRGSKRLTSFIRLDRAYAYGFGKVDLDFWLGFKLIHSLARKAGLELLVELQRNQTVYFARYSDFDIGGKSSQYRLKVGGYDNASTLPDSLSHSSGFAFLPEGEIVPTREEVIRQYGSQHCSIHFNGGWWYGSKGNESCSRVSFFADVERNVLKSPLVPDKYVWEVNGEKMAFDYVEMKVRPKTWECGKKQYRKKVLKQALLSQHPAVPSPFEENW